MSIELKIESLSNEGKGVARINGKVCFVEGSLPGEIVVAGSIRSQKSYSTAVTEKVVVASDSRIKPECVYFDKCGGCDLQHLAYDQQLDSKQQSLLETLEKLAKVEPEAVLPALTATPFRYRRRARFGVRFLQQENRVALGFRQPDRKYIVDIDSCLILDKRIDNLIAPLRELVSSLSCRDKLSEIEVSTGDVPIGIVFMHTAPLSVDDKTSIVAFATQYDIQVSARADLRAQAVPMDDDGSNNPNYLDYRLPGQNINLRFGSSDFVQVNSEINQQLVSAVLDGLDLQTTDTVLDLFCGIGNFSLPTARLVSNVCGIESDKTLVKRAIENAKLNKLDNAVFLQRDLYNATQTKAIGKKFNTLIVDPPRAGAMEVVKSLLPKIKPVKIAYVSCHPATMARDAEVLCGKLGYTMSSVRMVDMFPQTRHVEALAFFHR